MELADSENTNSKKKRETEVYTSDVVAVVPGISQLNRKLLIRHLCIVLFGVTNSLDL